tara:strand:- start:1270 stop:1728 length:459 start_codon:yes stop_codon:yes gene_type:complete
MKNPILIKHAQGAPGLRFFGIGAHLKPNRGIQKLAKLLKNNTSWASIRSEKDIKTMLRKSSVIVSIWSDNQMIGFGRATTDEIFRAVLWDVVVDKRYQEKGFGKKIVQAILQSNKVSKVEKVYIMTTNCKNFYSNLGFKIVKNQNLMLFENT